MTARLNALPFSSVSPAFLPVFLWLTSLTPGAAADKTTVVTFGDSTTATRGDLRIYSRILEEELSGVTIINAGVGGHNTKHARARFAKDVRAHDPDLVVIQFGINDAAVDVWKDPPQQTNRVSLAEYEKNLRHFVDTLKADGAGVILMTPNLLRWTPKMREIYGKPPYDPDDEDGFNRFLGSYARVVRELAAEKELPLVDVYRLFETYGESPDRSVDDLLLDGVHPNEAGQRIVAEGLLPQVRKFLDSLAKVKVAMNPEKSLLAEPGEATMILRSEDYVSNPPPGASDPAGGAVAAFPTPFAGFVQPSRDFSSLSPLPDPVGLLVESSSGKVSFYDPSSLVDCADLRGNPLLLRFVDPADTTRAASVSRLAFRLTGTAVAGGRVRYHVYDKAGKKLGSGTARTGPGASGAMAEIDVTATAGGKRSAQIHKLVVEQSGPGYFVIGGVSRASEPDIAFEGFTVGDAPVKRPLEETLPVSHAEQWKQNRNAKIFTDMTLCEPKEALSDRRHHDKWKVFEYETADFSGKCVSVGRESSAPDLTLRLDRKGWHAVYIGISTITDLTRTAPNQIEAKFTGEPAFQRFSNRLALGDRRRDVLEEIFVGVADLSTNDLQISTVYQMPARLHYVKAIPLEDREVAAIQSDRKQRKTRTSVATMDGFSWIHPFRPKTRADLASTFSRYRHSDFKTWWFQVGGADLVHHPGKVGNLMGGHLDTFPRSVDREYVESVRHLHERGIDPLKVAVEEAHAQDAEILVCLRAAGWKGAPPWEEFFMSEFYEAHPELRCVDYDGTPTMHMSYASEEVQNHLIKVYREVLERDPDGLGFLFHRGLPLMLWEKPFCDKFEKKFGVDPRTIPEDDPRVAAMRAEIMTSFMRKIRTLRDETKDRRLKMAVTTFATEADNRKFGLDVETWVKEGLVDQIGVAWFAYYTSGLGKFTGDNHYYAKITEGTDVKFFPFYIGWKIESAEQLIRGVRRDYREGADGIAVWDPEQFRGWRKGTHSYWPLLSKLGHRNLVEDGSLLFVPHATPLTRLGENHYSRWYPNTGF